VEVRLRYLFRYGRFLAKLVMGEEGLLLPEGVSVAVQKLVSVARFFCEAAKLISRL